MERSVGLVVGVTALAWAELAWLETEQGKKVRSDSLATAALGVASLIVLFVAVGYWTSRVPVSTWKRYTASFFLVTCWSGMIDNFLALSAVGLSELGAFYHINGEPYFKTAWGVAALLYDGTAHWLIESVAVVLLLTGRDYRPVGLLWAGSILNSMPVLLLGAATGKYAHEIQASTALNTPYVLAPLAVAFSCFLAGPLHRPSDVENRKPVVVRNGTVTRLLHVVVFGLHVMAISLRAVRAMAVLESKTHVAVYWQTEVEPVLLEDTGFARIQVLQDFFFLSLWHFAAVFDLVASHLVPQAWTWTIQEAFLKFSLFFLGATLQAQACWLSMIVFRWEEYSMHPAEFVNVPSLCIVALQLLLPLLHTLVLWNRILETNPVNTFHKKKTKSL